MQNYRRQDKDEGREINHAKFVSRSWLKNCVGKTCKGGCGDCLTFEIKDGKIESNLSANRTDNEQAHHVNNLIPMCVTCNQKLAQW